MTSKHRTNLQIFGIELAVYAVFVTIYFFAVLHFLGAWLKQMYDGDRGIYASVALLLIVAQGIGLEVLTSWLLRVIRKKIR